MKALLAGSIPALTTKLLTMLPTRNNALSWYNIHLQVIKKHGVDNSPLAAKYKTWCFKHRLLALRESIMRRELFLAANDYKVFTKYLKL